MPELWREPADVADADLFNGPWGAALAPDPTATYTFIKAKLHGASPGLTARDARGTEWSVKQGVEGPPEVAFSRVLSAIGYHQPAVYFLPSFALADGRRIDRVPGGRFRRKDAALRELGDWSWQQNPFVGTTPYHGLIVVMMVFNSSDLKDSNNTLYELPSPREGARRWFIVRDLGSALGETGKLDPSENDPDLFERHGFIRGVNNGFVEFSYRGWHQELVRDRITPGDVRWACDLLAKLSEAQWADAFRAGGYETSVAQRFIRRITAKIGEGQKMNR